MRHVGSDPQAERGRGEVNLSPIQGLTLRPRVGGFYVSGRLWEAQSIVFLRVWNVLGGSICRMGIDPQAEGGRGEVNLSPTKVLTLRLRVGGFSMRGSGVHFLMKGIHVRRTFC